MSHSVIRSPLPFAKPQVSLGGRFKDISGDLLVLWYGTLTPNSREKTVPLVNVHFRSVDPDGTLGAFYSVPIGLPYLSFFQVGTIWRAGSINSDTFSELLPELEVDFSPQSWTYVRASQLGLTTSSSPYKLPKSADTWLVGLRTVVDDQTILIPCVELLIRLYGRSSETSRILTTYPWQEVQARFFFDHEETWAKNVVKLQRSVRESDAVFLNHMRHDGYTKGLCRKLYADLESQFSSSPVSDVPFGNLQIAPWFQGPAKIKGRGYWLNKQTFLCLRLTGASEPDGPELEIHRAEYRTENFQPGDEEDHGLFVTRATKTLPLNQKFELTNDSGSDPDLGRHILEHESFEVLGKRRATSRYVHHKPGERGKKVLPTGETDVLSAGDPGGRGSGIGKAEIVDMEPWESSGVLVDVWLALNKLQAYFPTVIDRVEWMTLDGQRGTQAPAKLVPVKEFEEDETATPKQRAWVFLDPKLKIVRGVQILRIVCGQRHFYLFEIQRRSGNGKVDGKTKEQKAQGMLIELSMPFSQALVQLKIVLGLIRFFEGVFRDFVDRLDNPGVSFNHSKTKGDEVLHLTCMRNNLEKLGVNFPKRSLFAPGKDDAGQVPNR